MIKIAKRINLVGEIYGDFTVIEMLYGYKYVNNKPRTYCKCLGIDNNEYIIRADALRSGVTKTLKGACCKRNEDVSGQKFGYLTALYSIDERDSNGGIIWHCLCDCGNECDIALSSLKSGHTRSCGCRHRSKWEDFIYNYLTNINLKIEEQKRFIDCKNSKGSDMLPFDFYIYEYNSIIEYDGLHHFEPVKGWGGEEKFKITQENDNIKNKYCKEHNISLLRIPYTYTKEEIINAINLFLSPVEITA